MEDCPAEIWARIFSMACTDDGSTGRLLSRVSRYVRATSCEVRLQSIALVGHDQLHGFVNMLENTRPELRRVRHLCISHHDPPCSDLDRRDLGSLKAEDLVETYAFHQYWPKDKEQLRQRLLLEVEGGLQKASQLVSKRRKAFTSDMRCVLALVAPNLETLMLYMGPSYPEALHDIALPALRGLTVQGALFLPESLLQTGKPVVEMPPSLSHLHLIDSVNLFVAFLERIPRLTHLRMTGVTSWVPRVWSALSTAVLSRPVSAPSDGPTLKSDLPYLQRVILQVRGEPMPNSWMAAATTLERSAKVILLHEDARTDQLYWFPEAKKHWMERIVGEEGCWKVGPEAVNRRLKPTRLAPYGLV